MRAHSINRLHYMHENRGAYAKMTSRKHVKKRINRNILVSMLDSEMNFFPKFL